MSRRNNKRAPIDSTIQFDVAQAHASSDPANYRSRYTMTLDGSVIPRVMGANSKAPRIQLDKMADGTFEARIPQLALGTGGGLAFPLMNLAAPGESNAFGDTEYFGMWETVLDERDGKWDMRRAIRWWHRDPLVYRCIKLLCQLANSKVTFKSEDNDAQQLVDAWFKQAMPYSFRCAFFLEYFRTGYVPVLKTLVKYEPRNFKPNKIPPTGPGGNVEDPLFMPSARSRGSIETDVLDVMEGDEDAIKKAQAEADELAKHESRERATAAILAANALIEEEYVKAKADLEKAQKDFKRHRITADRLGYFQNQLDLKQHKWHKGQIPGNYTILDPLLVDLRGPVSMAWLREPYLNVAGDIQAVIRNPSTMQETVVNKLPQEIVEQIKNGSLTYVWLPPNICTIVTHDRQDYQRYPIPMMRHCFDALQMKSDIYAMDQATVRGIKSRVLLVKIGNDEYPVTDPATINHVAQIFNSVGRTGTFFWSHAIEMEWIEPDFSSFADASKYLHWNAEIRTCFGITPILTGGGEATGGAIGNQMISFKGVQMEVNGAQQAFVEMLDKEIRMLRAALSISADIEVSFDQINMKDETQFWTVVTQAVMNGIIDHQTALDILGFHFPQIADRMKAMKPLKKQGLFVPQPSANNMGPGGEMKPQGAGGAGGRQNNTRPAGKNKNKTNKSQPKKAKATMRAIGDDVYVLVEGVEYLEDDQLRDISALYNVKAEFVKTTAEFKKAFPNVDMSPEWPELTPLEAVQAAMGATTIATTTGKEFDLVCDTYKRENKGTERGAYLTPARKDKFQSVAIQKAQAEYLLSVANTSEIPKAWDKHFDTVRKGLSLQLEGVSEEQLNAQAFAMTALRYKKSKL